MQNSEFMNWYFTAIGIFYKFQQTIEMDIGIKRVKLPEIYHFEINRAYNSFIYNILVVNLKKIV